MFGSHNTFFIVTSLLTTLVNVQGTGKQSESKVDVIKT